MFKIRDGEIRGEAFASPHRELAIYRGDYRLLHNHFGKETGPIPDIYSNIWSDYYRELHEPERILLIPNEIQEFLTEEMEEYIKYRSIYLLNKPNWLIRDMKDEINADIYAMLMTGAKTGIMREIEEAYKKALDHYGGFLLRLWYMRGRKKELEVRERFVHEFKEKRGET